jgi:hypothetical protein
MEFLYGDSTSSPLATDFVDLLRKTIDCCVAVLLAEQRIAGGAARRQLLEARTEKDAARLHELEATVTRAIGLAIEGASPDTPVARCSDVILRAATSAVGSAEGELQSALRAEHQRLEEAAGKERARSVKAFEQLLLAHDLPNSERELRLEQRKDGTYSARLHITTGYGIAADVDLDIPAGSRFAQVVRVGDLAEGLEIQVPKSGGWLRKESRLASERLGRLVVMSCRTGARGQHVALRAEGIEEGYEFAWAPRQARVHATRVAPDLSGPVDFDLSEADSTAMAGFVEKLAATALELAPNRKALAQAQLDGEPLESRPPSLLVQRLVEVIAPTVREIAARSGSGDELIIRRLLGDGRREERFVKREELLRKLEPLSEAARALFAPLGLGPVPGNPPAPDDIEEISGGYILEERVVERASADGAHTPSPRTHS